jgi:pimeloyl-ACP methyl ester carboxylesterase
MWGDYTYQGMGRMQGFFDSPNLFAVVVGMSLVIALGLGDWAWPNKCPRASWVWRSFWWLAVLSLVTVLALTYSRGGWFAFCVGTAIYALLRGSHGKRAWLTLGLGMMVCLLVPRGGRRLVSFAAIEEDRSIAHRLIVWKSSLAMIRDYAWHGTGNDAFGATFNNWYRPLTLKPFYANTLNSILTLSLKYGMRVAFLYIMGIILLVWMGASLGKSAEYPPLLSISCSGLVFFTASMFTDLMDYQIMRWVLSAWGVAVIAICGWVLQRRGDLRFRLRWPLVSAALALVSCAGILVTSYWAAATLDQHIDRIPVSNEMGNTGVLITPNIERLRGALIYLNDEPGISDTLARSVLRAIAARGYATACNPGTAKKDLLGYQSQKTKDWILHQTKFEGLPLYVLGMNAMARLAIVRESTQANGRVKGVIAWGAAWEWSNPDESPREHLASLKVPLLLLHGNCNHIIPVNHSRKLAEERNRLELPAQIEIFPVSDHRLDREETDKFVAVVCAFMDRQSKVEL